MDPKKKELVDKLAKPKQPVNWQEEMGRTIPTLRDAPLTVSRIVYIGPGADPKKPKRCIALHKNGKTLSFDIEMAIAIAGLIEQLGEDYVPAELKTT